MTHDMAPVLVSADESGNPTTTSLVIAGGTENQHKNVLGLIRAHLADFEEFGRVAFQTRPFETAGGTQHREVAVLNEEHATLLITYLRNTEVVRRFKKSLVRAFFELRQRAAAQPALPDRRALAQMVIEAEDRADREAAARLEAEEQAAALAAPASAWQHMAAAAGDYAVGDAAKILSRDPAIAIGRDRLFRFMQAEGWIYRGHDRRKSWAAYQTQVDCGRLVEKAATPFLNQKTGEMELPAPTIRITAKGLAELHKRLGGSAVLATMAVSA